MPTADAAARYRAQPRTRSASRPPSEATLCRADYRRVGDTLHLVHTEVPPATEGRGIAGALVQAVLDYAAANGLKVIPQCSYVRALHAAASRDARPSVGAGRAV